jgi:hypothetical protein
MPEQYCLVAYAQYQANLQYQAEQAARYRQAALIFGAAAAGGYLGARMGRGF